LRTALQSLQFHLAVKIGFERDLTYHPKSWVGDFAAMTGTDIPAYTREAPGMSAFALSDGVIYYAYSTYARGLDALWGMYQWLDRAPNGRNEPVPWFRRHDEYTQDSR
jgi:predicted dithiol-disulfide oxidoreductase (DUF899 family)